MKIEQVIERIKTKVSAKGIVKENDVNIHRYDLKAQENMYDFDGLLFDFIHRGKYHGLYREMISIKDILSEEELVLYVLNGGCGRAIFTVEDWNDF